MSVIIKVRIVHYLYVLFVDVRLVFCMNYDVSKELRFVGYILCVSLFCEY